MQVVKRIAYCGVQNEEVIVETNSMKEEEKLQESMFRRYVFRIYVCANWLRNNFK